MRRPHQTCTKNELKTYIADHKLKQVGKTSLFIDAYGTELIDIYYEDAFSYDYLHRDLTNDTCINNAGYKLVNTSRGLMLVHRLVAEAWLKPSLTDLSLKEVDHIDGNKLNNAYTNLQYLSHAANVKKSWSVEHKAPTYVGRYNRKTETICLKDSIRIHMSPEEYVAWRIDRKLPIKGWMIPYATKSKNYLIDDFSL